MTSLDDTLGDEYPELREMLLVFGSRQIRNRATMGGNLVTASPIGDCAPVLLALDARVVLASARGERVLPLEEFFVSYRKTALQAGEILKSILLPRLPAQTRSVRRFFKASKRREMDISTVAGAFAVRLSADGIIEQARLAYGGVAAMPVRARKSGKRSGRQTVAPGNVRGDSAAFGSGVHSHLRCARQRQLSPGFDQDFAAEVFRGGK